VTRILDRGKPLAPWAFDSESHAIRINCGGHQFDVAMEAQDQIAYWRWDSEGSVRLFFPLLEYHQLRFVPNVLLYWLLSNRLAVAVICWAALLLRLHVLCADYE
jgi:hypothetical protein